MEKLKNRFEIRLVCNTKDYLKWTSKPSYMSQKIFDNDLVVIRKKKKEINTYQTTISSIIIAFKINMARTQYYW